MNQVFAMLCIFNTLTYHLKRVNFFHIPLFQLYNFTSHWYILGFISKLYIFIITKVHVPRIRHLSRFLNNCENFNRIFLIFEKNLDWNKTFKKLILKKYWSILVPFWYQWLTDSYCNYDILSCGLLFIFLKLSYKPFHDTSDRENASHTP